MYEKPNCYCCFMRYLFRWMSTLWMNASLPKEAGRPSPWIRTHKLLTTLFLFGSISFVSTVMVLKWLFKTHRIRLCLAFSHVFRESTNFYLTVLLTTLIGTTIQFLHFAYFTQNRESETLCKIWRENYHTSTLRVYRENAKTQEVLQKVWVPVILTIVVSIQSVSTIVYSVPMYREFSRFYNKALAVAVSSCLTVSPILCTILWMSMALYVALTALALAQKFREVSTHLETILNCQTDIEHLKMIQIRHRQVIDMVMAADVFLSPFIFFMYVCTIPSTCVVLRYLVMTGISHLRKTVLFEWILSLIVCIGITLIYGRVVVNAHKPEKILYEIMNMPLKSNYKLQINLFLERLHGPTIGLSCSGIFVVTYGTLSNLCSMITTYLLMYVQYSTTSK